MLGIVGESGSGKTDPTLSSAARLTPSRVPEVTATSRLLYAMSEAERRTPAAYRMGRGHQTPDVTACVARRSAGGNIGERLMAHRRPPLRQHPRHRRKAGWKRWRSRPAHRRPAATTFSGGMQQRLQIARNLVLSRSWCLWMNPPAGSIVRAGAAA
ncbi:ATP-binding cassette domain-containing protein [Pseudomonas aeruginosa]